MTCSLIYLDRFVKHNYFAVTMREIHRLLAIACIVSAKFHLDDFCDNEYYSRVAGISLDEVNDLEVTFLEALDYKLFVSSAELRKYSFRLGEIFKAKDSEGLNMRSTSIFPKYKKRNEAKRRDYSSDIPLKKSFPERIYI